MAFRGGLFGARPGRGGRLLAGPRMGTIGRMYGALLEEEGMAPPKGPHPLWKTSRRAARKAMPATGPTSRPIEEGKPLSPKELEAVGRRSLPYRFRPIW